MCMYIYIYIYIYICIYNPHLIDRTATSLMTERWGSYQVTERWGFYEPVTQSVLVRDCFLYCFLLFVCTT